jgi:imidazolonepropionase-like amidohydrolase
LIGARIITVAPPTDGGPRTANGDVIENGTIVIDRNRITAIGPSRSVSVPANARRIDVAGKTIMPGMIDVHAHVGGEGDGILAQSSWPLMANLAFGVTTSHDPSNDSQTVFTNAELIRSGVKLGPRLFSTGTILYGAETPFKAVIETYDDALSHLRRQKAMGAFSVKSYNQQRLDGHTGVEHSLPVPKIYKDVVTLFAKSRSGYTPTLIVGYGGLSGVSAQQRAPRRP